jgi:hypothetical protein
MDDWYQTRLRKIERIKQLMPGDPPPPWKRLPLVGAAGVFNGGWTQKDDFLLISLDGYSVYSLTDETFHLFEMIGSNAGLHYLDDYNRRYQIPKTGEIVHLFGVLTGHGIKNLSNITGVRNSWAVDVIYPHWPDELVILYQRNWLSLESVFPIALENLEHPVFCGFSPSCKYLAILGHAGAEFFVYEDT